MEIRHNRISGHPKYSAPFFGGGGFLFSHLPIRDSRTPGVKKGCCSLVFPRLLSSLANVLCGRDNLLAPTRGPNMVERSNSVAHHEVVMGERWETKGLVKCSVLLTIGL